MTIEEIKSSDKPLLTVGDICRLLRRNPQKVREQAFDDPATLGFPVTVIGRRIHIPRASFVKWWEENCIGTAES